MISLRNRKCVTDRRLNSLLMRTAFCRGRRRISFDFARSAIVVMISNSDAHVVAPYVMGDLIINTYRDKRRSGNVAVQGASRKIKLLQRICAILDMSS